MPKDDYFAIAYRILEYLYSCLRQGVAPELEHIAYDSKAIGINRNYWEDIIRNLTEDGLISGVAIVPISGSSRPGLKVTELRITPKGIQYLEENSMMQKAGKMVKTVFETIGWFV